MTGYFKPMVSLVLALAMMFTAGAALAMDKEEADIKIREATLSLNSFMKQKDKNAPLWLLKRAKAIIIIPGMVKAGFIVGGKYGVGVVCARLDDGSWSAPAFIEMAGANVGFQIGAQASDYFLMVMKPRGLAGILKNQFKAGVDASVAAGPVGREAAASLSSASLKADMYSYSRSKGAYAGAVVEGAGFGIQDDSNQAYYGKYYNVDDIIRKNKVTPPESAKELIAALNKFGEWAKN
jgi:lipid-binding SYLF domain-containing protein